VDTHALRHVPQRLADRHCKVRPEPGCGRMQQGRIVQRVVLPASFTGGQRYVFKSFQVRPPLGTLPCACLRLSARSGRSFVACPGSAVISGHLGSHVLVTK